MLEELKKFLENSKQIQGTEVEKILTTRSNLDAFSKFYEMFHEELGLITAVTLYNFQNDENFTKEEIIAYKKGLYSMGVFFLNAFKRNKELEQLEKGKVLDNK